MTVTWQSLTGHAGVRTEWIEEMNVRAALVVEQAVHLGDAGRLAAVTGSKEPVQGNGFVAHC